jgi:hypothetical protein
MPSTHDSSLVATAAEGSPVPPWLLGDSFAALPDPRSRQGRRFTLAALLTLALAAMLANHLSPFAIAAWGAEQDAASKRAMGFAKGVTPHQSTFQRLFRRLDPAALSAALTDHGAANDSSDAPVRGGEGVAIDGKAQCGRLAFATTPACPVHALTACTHASGMVLARRRSSAMQTRGRRN